MTVNVPPDCVEDGEAVGHAEKTPLAEEERVAKEADCVGDTVDDAVPRRETDADGVADAETEGDAAAERVDSASLAVTIALALEVCAPEPVGAANVADPMPL